MKDKNGSLEIVRNYLLTNFLIPIWVTKLKQNNKDINIEINTLNTEIAINQLISYQVDVAVLGGGAMKYIDKINSSIAAKEFIDIRKLARIYVDNINLKNEIVICV